MAAKKCTVKTSVSLPKALEGELREWADASEEAIRDKISEAVEAHLKEVVAALGALWLRRAAGPPAAPAFERVGLEGPRGWRTQDGFDPKPVAAMLPYSGVAEAWGRGEGR